MKRYFPGFVIRAGVIGGLVAIAISLAARIPSVPLQSRVILSCIIVTAGWLVYPGTGIIAARWSKRANLPRTVVQSGIDGMIAGGIAGGVGKTISLAIGFITDPLLGGVGLFDAVLVGMILDTFGSEGIGLVLSAIMRCIGFTLEILLTTILGGISAMLYTAISRPYNKPSIN